MTFTATFLDATDKGASKTITVRFDDEPEDREIESLMLRYNATQCIVEEVMPENISPEDRNLSLLWSISEPITPIDENRIVDCLTCDGATRTFDDPADCPDCGGARYVVL